MKTDFLLIRPARLSDGVVKDLVLAIAQGHRLPGQKLPTEFEMAASYGVSRAVIREAMAQLKADGIVQVRQGAGAYIAASPGSASFKITPPLDADDLKLRHLFELRLCVESTAAALAAVRRQPKDLEVIETYLAQMRSAQETGQDGSHADGLYHEAIATASGNPELARFINFLGQNFTQTRKPSWTAKREGTDFIKDISNEHNAIFAAIVARDSGKARIAAENHILNSETRTFTQRH